MVPFALQVRPWMLAEADYVLQPFMQISLRWAVFIGGVPRPIRAVELAHMIDELYGNVVMAGIDTDLPLKYPKGAGRVVFSDFHSYMRAITDKYVRLQHGDIDKVVSAVGWTRRSCQSRSDLKGWRCIYWFWREEMRVEIAKNTRFEQKYELVFWKIV